MNNLVHSIPNVVQGNTILHPYHKDGSELKKFDYIVSNPPFKLDFSDFRDDLDTTVNKERFFNGIPKIKPKEKDKMEIYQLFIQHIISSLNSKGKAAIVLPTGFITNQTGIDKAIRKYIVENKILSGVISMPSNIFATTGTNVSILFLDKNNNDKPILIDASSLGEKIKEGKNQKTVLTFEEEQKIIDIFINKKEIKNLSISVDYETIAKKSYSFSAGQHFQLEQVFSDISKEDFQCQINLSKDTLTNLFKKSKGLEEQIINELNNLGLH